MNRMLSPTERFMYYIDCYQRFNMQIIVSLNGKIDEGNFKSALDKLQQQHPFLRTTLVRREDSCFLIDCITSIDYVKLDKDKDISAIAENALKQTTIHQEKPMMNAIWLLEKENHTIIFTINHMISDGISFCQLVSDFFEHIQNDVYEESRKIIPSQARPTLEKLLKFDYTNIQYASLPPYSDSNVIDLIQRNKLSKIDSENFFAKSKSLNTSVHNILSAIMLISLYKSRNYKQPTDMVCDCPINLRPYLPEELTQRDLGNYVTGTSLTATVSMNSTVIELARQLEKQLKEYLSSQQVINNAIETTEDFIRNNIKKNILNINQPMVGVSNLGKIDLSSNFPHYKIHEFHCYVSNHSMWAADCPAIMIPVTCNKQLFFTIIFDKNIMHEKDADSYKENLFYFFEKFIYDD